MITLTATYSPEDNKLRLYASARLDRELYLRVRSHGFIHAPKQDLFVAPMWTPAREDFLLELCGDIGDEDSSLVDRAEARADRFGGYSEKRAADAGAARAYVERITSGIPLGQPILVGHHSEARARKDAERIENGMRKAVNMWETSVYWTQRAAGVLRHAKYKDRADVRARRIKGLEAGQRKQQRSRDLARALLSLWQRIDNPNLLKRKDGAEVSLLERALYIANRDHISRKYPLADFPRDPPASQYEGDMGLWSALNGGVIDGMQAAAIAIPVHERTIQHCDRWIAHYANRIAYERALLDEQGAGDMLKPPPRPKQLPLCNYRAPDGLDVQNMYRRGELIHYPQIEMTQAEYAKIPNDYKGTRVVGNSHRVRTAVRGAMRLCCVFLTDSKVHDIPAPKDPAPRELPPLRSQPVVRTAPAANGAEFEAMKEQLEHGVQVVSANQLFPTPRALARRMVDLGTGGAGCAGLRMLEPSAGTGVLLDAIIDDAGGADCCSTVAVEINRALAADLERRRNLRLYANEATHRVICADFLECGEELGKFDLIVMNPPFENASDVKHIEHALTMLKPGGRLVAICAGGSRQESKLRPIVEKFGGKWEPLPADTFAESGTGVQTVLLSLQLPHAAELAA